MYIYRNNIKRAEVATKLPAVSLKLRHIFNAYVNVELKFRTVCHISMCYNVYFDSFSVVQIIKRNILKYEKLL